MDFRTYCIYYLLLGSFLPKFDQYLEICIFTTLNSDFDLTRAMLRY
jgi:hypothetical protein